MLAPDRAGKSKRRRGRRDAHGEGIFVVEVKRGDGRWAVRNTRRTERAALDCAWELLSREGAEVRVCLGELVIAEGTACRSREDTTML